MKIDVPIQALPQLFFKLKMINKEDKKVLSIYLETDSITQFIQYLTVLGFELFSDDTNIPTTCKGMTFNIEVPDGFIEIPEVGNLVSQYKSIW